MLTYDISERGNLTIYEYLYRCIKDDIIKGRLSLGEKLPSKRKMAQQHQISLKTVENAYEQLLMEGYISAREKSGYYVMEAEAGYEPRRRTSYTAMQTGSRGEEASNITIDLTSNRAAIEKFPYDTWAKVMRGILSEKENVLLDTVPFAGVYELRVEIARYLYEYRGMDVEPEQIIIGAGTEYLYGRLLQLLGRNSIYAIEDPGYHRFSRIYHANDLQWCYVEIDEDGIVIDSLKQSGANVVHVSPGHHFPTGIIMPAGRRQELLAWTQEELGRYIIEDDYDSEFRYRGKPVPSLQASDAAGKVIYMGTFSKSIAPAIRVGYMVLPEALLERYRQKCACFSCTVSRVDQAVLEQFLDSGAFERHLNRMRKSYSRKHEALLDGLKPFFRQFDLSGENAGLHLLLTDRVGRSEKELVDAARRQGVKVYGLSSALVGAAVPEAVCRATVLIGFGGLTEDEIRDGLERLAAAWLIEKRL